MICYIVFDKCYYQLNMLSTNNVQNNNMLF